MKKLMVAAMVGFSIVTSGCSNNNQLPPAQQNQAQEVKQAEGISLTKAIDLAKKGKFKPQTVKFEATISNKVFGDEPEIIVKDWIEMGGLHKPIEIHITDPTVIKRVAKLQEERQNNYVKGTGSIHATEINIEQWKIEVK